MKKYIGIDLGGTTIKGGLFQKDTMIRKEVFPVNKDGSAENIMKDIIDLIRSLKDDELQSIGFAVPALIHQQDGIIHGIYNIPQLDGIPIKRNLEREFHVPVFIQNDANCFVLGEWKYGLAKGYRNIVGLITGTGVGAGIIIDEKLYHGTNYGAGEFGMISYKDKNFESYCGGLWFTENFNKSGEDMAQLAANGDKNALSAFLEYGKNLGELIKLIRYTYDPQLIVIGGSISKSFTFYGKTLVHSMENYSFTDSHPVMIQPSGNENIALYGAASLCL